MLLAALLTSCGQSDDAIAASEGQPESLGSGTNSMTADSMTADSMTADSMTADSMTADSMTADSMTADSMTSSGNDGMTDSTTSVASDDSNVEPMNTDVDVGAPSSAELEWRCVEFDGAPDWFCLCEEAPAGSHAEDLTQERCAHTAYPCCVAEPLTGECVCDYTADCANLAAFKDGVEVASCPPEQGADELEALLPTEDEPVCNGGNMSCGVGSPRCDHVEGSCPLCFVCQDANLDPSCTAPDDDLQVLGVPECLDVPDSELSPESAQVACLASIVSYSFDGDRSITYGVTCVDPANHASVPARPSCTEEGAIPFCDAFQVSCVLVEERELPAAQRTPLGAPICEPG